MSNVLITGDIHATIDFKKIAEFRRKFKEMFTRDDILIIAGDFGFIWTDEPNGEEKFYLKWFDENAPWTTIFIDGNHENHPRLNAYPVTEYRGAKVHQISESVYHVLRGEVLSIDDLKILCLGGADSHDKFWRVENIDWWAEEQITQENIDNALANVEKCGGKVDYVVTHSFPTVIMKRIFPYMQATPSTDLLDNILYNVEVTRSWITGHYHEDMAIQEQEGYFRIIYDDIVTLYLEEYVDEDNS
jgi:hypothetical protein